MFFIALVYLLFILLVLFTLCYVYFYKQEKTNYLQIDIKTQWPINHQLSPTQHRRHHLNWNLDSIIKNAKLMASWWPINHQLSQTHHHQQQDPAPEPESRPNNQNCKNLFVCLCECCMGSPDDSDTEDSNQGQPAISQQNAVVSIVNNSFGGTNTINVGNKNTARNIQVNMAEWLMLVP